MDTEEVEEYVEQSHSLLEDAPQMDEATTRMRLVQPFISLLGWDVYSSEVEPEFSVQLGAGTKKVDYALMLEESPVVFIEAKGCDRTLSKTDKQQLQSYMRVVGVDWGVLTNGKTFEILKRRPDTTRPEELSLGKHSFDELRENADLLDALSRASLETGKSETIARNIQKRREAVQTLQREKESFAERITGMLTDELGDSFGQQIERESKEFIENLVSRLDGQIEPRSRESENPGKRGRVRRSGAHRT